jgi:hypothetical protein
MRLMKFFRQYTRVLVLSIMSLLLVIFLVQDVITSRFRGGREYKQQIGSAFDQPIYTSDLNRLDNERGLLASLRIPPVAIDTNDTFEYSLCSYLLFEEARRFGIHINQDQVVETLRASDITDADMERIRDMTGRSLASIYAAVAERLAVTQYLALQLEALQASTPRAELAFRDQNQQAVATLSVIDAAAFVSRVPEPTDAELQTAYEQGRDRQPATTEDEFVFGYRQPDRVEAEVLTIDPQSLLESVQVREKEARAFYDENKSRYVRTTFKPTGPDDPAGAMPMERIQQGYEEVKDRVKEDARVQKAALEAQRRLNEIRDELRRPWQAATLGPDGFRTPSAGPLASFQDAAVRYSTAGKVEYEKLGPLSAAAIDATRGIGLARYQAGTTSLAASQLMLRVKGLLTPTADEQLPALNINEPGPLLLRIDTLMRSRQPYQGYIFRVIRAIPAGPVETLDAVREQVVADLKRQKAFELARDYANALAERARAVGLAAAIADDQDLRAILTEAQAASQPAEGPAPPRYLAELGPFTPSAGVTRRSTWFEHVGESKNLARRIFERIDAQGAESAPAQAIELVPNAAGGKWIIAQIGELKPIFAGDFAKQRQQFASQAASPDRQAFVKAWTDPANIRRRAGFVPAAPPRQ